MVNYCNSFFHMEILILGSYCRLPPTRAPGFEVEDGFNIEVAERAFFAVAQIDIPGVNSCSRDMSYGILVGGISPHS